MEYRLGREKSGAAAALLLSLFWHGGASSQQEDEDEINREVTQYRHPLFEADALGDHKEFLQDRKLISGREIDAVIHDVGLALMTKRQKIGKRRQSCAWDWSRPR